jgi:Tfp pilus assembly protein PilZ
MATDRRTPPRVRVKWPVVIIADKGVIVAETRDISSEGAFISCDLPLSPREKVKIFIMAPNRRPFELPAEVAWSSPHDASNSKMSLGMGVRFTEVSTANRQILLGLLEHLYQSKLTSNSSL